jgi:hypothetical protein
MSHDIPPQSPPLASLPDATQISHVIQQELDRSNKYLEFAQGQITKDREFYKHLYSYAFAFIAFMVLVAGLFQYSNVSQMRNDMKASVDAQIDKSKAEIEAIRAQATTANLEAQATVARELANVRTEVQKRIDTEFQNDNITKLVEAAAKSKTEKEFAGIVQAETLKQVAQAITAQQPFIRKAVEDQTTKAVKDLEPTIRSSVNQATEDQVNKSIVPIKRQMRDYADSLSIGNMTIIARNDDRQAFDYLQQVAIGNKPESANLELRTLAESTVSAINADLTKSSHEGVTFPDKKTPEALRKLMSSSETIERREAVGSYPVQDHSVLPLLVQLIRNDPSIKVLSDAMWKFDEMTKQTFSFDEVRSLLDWWEKNQKDVK